MVSGPEESGGTPQALTTPTYKEVEMAKSKILQNTDLHGTDRRTFLLGLPPAVGSLEWLRGSPQEEQEFQRLLLRGVQEVLDTNHREAFQIAITVCYSTESVVKEKLIPLASRLYPHGCQCGKEKIEDPHPRQLFRCQECGDRIEKVKALEARIPEDHPMKIEMSNALFNWKNEKSTNFITARIVAEGEPIEEAVKAEMKKLGIWPWGNGGDA